MGNNIRSSSRPKALAPSIPMPPLADAMDAVHLSVDRFCLLAGVEALAEMMEEDATTVCGARHRRHGDRRGYRWGRTHSEIGYHGGKVTETLMLALEASGCNRAEVVHKPRLLLDNGSSYIAGDLADWLEDQGMDHVRGAPNHPQTQSKIERWHQTLKNRILLENYYLPGDLEAQVGAFVEHYNHRRYHESLGNLTPADVYFGRDKAIIKRRKSIKKQTIEKRRLAHQRHAA